MVAVVLFAAFGVSVFGGAVLAIIDGVIFENEN